MQTANQYYNVMVTQYVLRSIERHQDQQESFLHNEQSTEDNDEVTVHLSGKYKLIVTNVVLHSMRQGNRMYVNWHSDVKGI